MTSPDVVVVGGGAIGLSIAWRLARSDGAVAVVDPEPGRGASWAAAGMLAPVTEVHFGEEALLSLNLLSAERYPAFVAELEDASGVDTHYRRTGTLMVARDVDENAQLEEVFRFQEKLGLEVARLRSRECRELEPGLARTVRGGVLVEGDHQVDNRALVDALTEACRREGTSLIEREVTAVERSGDRATGVSLGDDRIACGTVVLAAGCRSASIPGVPAGAVPVRPVKGQLLHLRARTEVPAARNIRGAAVYMVPRVDGRVVVGATVEDQGFDTAVTAGATYELLRDAYELLPGIIELELTETVAGLRPGTPDNAPLLGTTGIDGLVVATGHFRNGILLAPVTADGIAELVSAGRVPDHLEPFSPTRFQRSEVPA